MALRTPMAAKSPLTLAFNLPFVEAIKAAELRGVQLPSVYYGQLQGLARQQAFSIAGIASLDQLQAVKNSLDEFMRSGGSFNAWKKKAAVLDLNLPAHRLDNIWRTNLQGNYLRGHWEQFVRNAESRPYLMYDAINDSRTRPSHLAMDGVIRPVGDPYWRTRSAPNGFRCRCNMISLTEEQAMARSRPNPDGQGTGIYKTPQLEGGIPAEPDKGWDYNPFEDRLAPLRKALERFDPKLRAVGDKILNRPVRNAPTLSDMEILDFVAAAKTGNVDQRTTLGQVHDVDVQFVAASFNRDIAGYTRTLEASAIRHVFKSHGNPAREANRQQIAVVAEDFLMLYEITELGMKSPGEKLNRGSPTMVTEYTINGIRYHLVESIRNGNVTMVTFRKHEA